MAHQKKRKINIINVFPQKKLMWTFSKMLHVNIINSELELVKNWCSRNKLTLNLSKTSYLVLKTHQNQNSLEDRSIKTGNAYLNEKNSIEIFRSRNRQTPVLEFTYTKVVQKVETDVRHIA